MPDAGEERLRPEDRRHFRRIEFDAEVELQAAEASDSSPPAHQVTLFDISFKGLLVSRPQGWVSDHDRYLIRVRLANGGAGIEMLGHCAHVEDDMIGFVCDQIGIESATCLRRLIELNLGDPALLQRELRSLIEFHSDHHPH